MSQIISSYDEGLARMHDMVWDEHNGWLAIKKNHTSGSTICENDWGWIPVFRSKTKLDEMLGGRRGYSSTTHPPDILLVPDHTMASHPVISQLQATNHELMLKLHLLEEKMGKLLTQQPIQESPDQLAGRKLIL